MAPTPKKSKSKKSRKDGSKKRPRSTKSAEDNMTLKNEDSEQSKRFKKEEEMSDSSGLPGKKSLQRHNISTESSQLRIEVAESSSSSNPVVVSFPTGVPPSMAAVSSSSSTTRTVRFEDDSNGPKPPVFTWTKVRKSSSKGRIIHGSDETCTYIASNEGKGYDGRLTKFYVGLYHKPTSSVKLIPASEKGTVFAMGQAITDYNDSKSMNFRNLSIAERRRMVFESFGSQKKKKVMRSQQANVVEMKSVVGAGEGMMKALGKQMDDNKMSESNLKVMKELKKRKENGETGKMMSAADRAHDEARRSYLPPFDESAMDPYRVYDSQEVAGDDAWSKISNIVVACIHKGDEWKKAIEGKYEWPKATKALLDTVKNHQSSRGKYTIKTIVLVNYLVQFHNRANKKFMDGSPEELKKKFGLPREVSDRFLLLFCVPSYDKGRAGFATSKHLKDRRVLYTLIMYLLAHGKEMKIGSIASICEDLRLETKDAINLYREAGCTCVKNKTTLDVSVSLQVPLKFPPPKRGKKT